MKKLIYLFSIVVLIACAKSHNNKKYRVEHLANANFSIKCPELHPDERWIIKLNGLVLYDCVGGQPRGNPGFWGHYRFPQPIKRVEFYDFYKGKLKIYREFKDTLLRAKGITFSFSRPFPKGMTAKNWHPYGYVSIDTGDRKIELWDNAVLLKDMWTDNDF